MFKWPVGISSKTAGAAQGPGDPAIAARLSGGLRGSELDRDEPGEHRSPRTGRLLLIGLVVAAMAALALPAFASARPETSVTVTPSAPGPYAPGQTVNFEVKVKNVGTTATPNENWNLYIGRFGQGIDFVSVEADDSYYISSSGTCHLYTNSSVNCGRLPSVLGSTVLQPGETAPTIEVTGRVAADAPATINFPTSLSILSCATCAANADMTLDVTQSPVMKLSMKHTGIFRRGQTGNYDIDVSNASDSVDATDPATITDTLPDGLSFDSASSAGDYWDCSASSGQDVSCTGTGTTSNPLAHGDSAPTLHLSVDVASDAPDEVENTATADTTGNGGVDLNSATDETPIFSAAAERIVLTVGATGEAEPANNAGSYLSVENAAKDPDPFTGDFSKTTKPTLVGVLDGDSIFIPESGVHIPTVTGPVFANTGLPNTFGTAVTARLQVTTVPTDDWTGTLDASGGIDLDMPAKFEYTPRLVAPLQMPFATCESGPVDLAPSGTISNGNGVLTDDAFTVGAATCSSIQGILYQQGLTPALAGAFVNQWSGTSGGTAPGSAHARFQMHLAKPENGPALTVENTVDGFADRPVLHVVNGEVDPSGSAGTYTIKVANSGSAATSGPVSITESLPDGLTFASATSTGDYWDCSASAGAQVSCVSDGTAIGAGSEAPALTLVVNVTEPAYPSVTTAASASGGGAVGTITTPNVSEVRVDGPLLNLNVTQYEAASSQNFWTVGAPDNVLNVTPRLTTPGGLTASSMVNMQMSLPPGVRFSGDFVPPVFGGGTPGAGWTCSNDPAPGGSGLLLNCTVRAQQNIFGTYTIPGAELLFDVSSDAAAGDGPTADIKLEAWYQDAIPKTDPIVETSGVQVTRPQLKLSMSHVGDFRVGGSGGTFTLGLDNGGNGSTTDNPTTITNVLPEGLIVQDIYSQGDYWDCSASVGQKVSCTNENSPAVLSDGYHPKSWDGEIGPGMAAPDLKIDVSVNKPPVARLNLHATAESGPSETATASDTVNTGQPSLAVSSTHSGSFTVGETGVYNLTVKNQGSADTDGSPVTLTDTLPDGLSYAGAASTGNYWSCSAAGTKVTCTSSGVLEAASAAPVLRLSTHVTEAAYPSGVNVVRASGGGSLPAGDSDPTAIVKAPATPPDSGGNANGSKAKPHLAKLKVRPKVRRIAPGKSATFKVRIRNNGKAKARRAKVCIKAPRRLVKVRGKACKKLGNIRPGKAKTRKFKVRLKHRAKRKKSVKLKLTAHARGAKKRSARAKIKVKSGNRRHRGR